MVRTQPCGHRYQAFLNGAGKVGVRLVRSDAPANWGMMSSPPSPRKRQRCHGNGLSNSGRDGRHRS